MQLKIREVLKIYNKLKMVVREGRKHTIANFFYEEKYLQREYSEEKEISVIQTLSMPFADNSF